MGRCRDADRGMQMVEVAAGQPDGAITISRAELIIGLVGALGTDLERVASALEKALMRVGYRTALVRVSALIDSQFGALGLKLSTDPPTHIDELMDKGDTLRELAGDGGITAALAISNISSTRHNGIPADSEVFERASTATVIRQLKHPAEVKLLRSTYGPRFVLIGAWSPKSEREHLTRLRLEEKHSGAEEHWYAQHVTRLLERDEKDGLKKLGQRVRDTYEMADAYVALIPGWSIDGTVDRIVSLLFGAPFETPTRQEQAMYQASGARLRSSAAGRQVGAVVIDSFGEVLVTGTNDAPRSHGGQYWAGEEPDFRDFRYGFDQNDRQQLLITTDIFRRLKGASNWLTQEKEGKDPETLAVDALSNEGPLRDSRVGDLLEFGRILHAEMAAICTAARRGTALEGCVMFTTTYPCHECARLIIGAGISQLYYVDPYPKSQVPSMYKDEVTEGPSNDSSRVIFEPYQGVAPRLYQSVFSMRGRSRDPVSGRYEPWNPVTARPCLVAEADVVYPIQYMEDFATERLGVWIDAAGSSDSVPDS